jgi:hypothetical protein
MATAKVYRLPLVRSPLEFGRWYTKPTFEQHYGVRQWREVVRFTDGAHTVRCSGFALIALLREHAAAYFQLAWNAQAHRGSIEVAVGSGKRQQWRPYPITHAPGSTIRLRICYALTPQRDTEVVLHDGYGLPMRDRWWETIRPQVVVLTPPRHLAA